MQILVATSWATPCGIADHSAQAIAAITAVDPTLAFGPYAEALDPAWVLEGLRQRGTRDRANVLWLNYHRALHSRWTPDKVAEVQSYGVRVVITWHDSRGELPPDALERDLCGRAEAFIVHEPCEGLERAIYLRQGVHGAVDAPIVERIWAGAPPTVTQDRSHPAFPEQMPVLGTCGFHFPWKNYDQLAQVTAEQGWAFLLCCNNATDADEARWRALNPWLFLKRGWLETAQTVAYLAACDATVFAYECQNTGTSGAIRLGLAARKPVIAWVGCRQMRDLYGDTAIAWCPDFSTLPAFLAGIAIGRCDPGIVALAERDSWRRQAQQYAAIFHRVGGVG